MLAYAAGETEALFDKAEAACHEAREEADRLPEMQSLGVSSSEMSEACQKARTRNVSKHPLNPHHFRYLSRKLALASRVC